MILPWLPCCLPLLVTLFAFIRQLGLAGADADYESVRVRFDYPYMGGKGGDPKAKYWRKFEPTAIRRLLTVSMRSDESV